MLYAHKLETKAAARLKELYLLDDADSDGWSVKFSWSLAFNQYLLKSSAVELKRIVALADVPLDYAYDCLFNLFSKDHFAEFPFECSDDLQLVPRGLLV